MTDEQRRLTFLRDNVEHLEEEKNTLESLLYTVQTASEEDAAEIFRRLRSGGDVTAVAQQVLAGRLLSEVRGESTSSWLSRSGYSDSSQSSQSPVSNLRLEYYEQLMRTIAASREEETSEITKRIRNGEDVSSILAAAKTKSLVQPLPSAEADVTPGIEAEYSGRDKTFGMVKGTGTPSTAPETTFGRLREVSTPLLGQPWTTVTDDEDFIEHLLGLYFAWQHCFFQSFPEKLFREDMAKGGTEYCSRLLVNAILAAGCLLSRRPEARRDPSDSRTAGLDFFEEALRLLADVDTSSLPTTAALYLICHVDGTRGRLSSLWLFSGRSSRMALDINLHLRNDRTPADHLTGEAYVEEKARLHAFWGCFISDQVTSFTLGRLPQIPTSAVTVDLPPVDPKEDAEEWCAYDIDRPRKPSNRSTTFNQVAALSKIVNSTLQLFFAPTVALCGNKLLEEYAKYTSWYKALPSIVSTIDDGTPHVLCLHMYYHAAVLLLFRPFLKATFTKSPVSPREVCRQSADAISKIFAQHRRLYDLAGIYTFQVHCLLTACTIHIINVPALSSTSYLTAACNNFQDLIHRNEWATGSLNIIKGLVQKWNIILPLDAETALYRNAHKTSDFSFGNESQAQIYRPEKRSHFLNPSTQVMQKRQRLAPRETREQPTNYLFAPFPNHPAPLLGPVHTSTSADTEHNDELNKVAQGLDGLSFGDDWFDPFMGYQGDEGTVS
ncbi:hypothetical protein LTR16_001762 [Cryomyces antarcticus]|uniref:Xylanolytic transcriptional activator regulatory domain-containing protein n=1 Tax=Cryomyces antarcticus TaxID=329879 RepID=A0ABR0LQ32_9PEZI|nr:hypothetical protein LTR16_001762 [Cryomyces antarcticus]